MTGGLDAREALWLTRILQVIKYEPMHGQRHKSWASCGNLRTYPNNAMTRLNFSTFSHTRTPPFITRLLNFQRLVFEWTRYTTESRSLDFSQLNLVKWFRNVLYNDNQLQRCWETPTKIQPSQLSILACNASLTYNTIPLPLPPCSSKIRAWWTA